MRRPRACLAHTSSGRLGSASGPTTWLCLQWLDADRMKAGESQPDRGACRARPVPEARSPRPKSPRMERREATRFPSHGKRNNTFAPRGAPCPSPFQGARLKAHLARSARANARGCLKFESEFETRRDASAHPLVVPAFAGTTRKEISRNSHLRRHCLARTIDRNVLAMRDRL